MSRLSSSLLTLEETHELSIDEVHDLFRRYVNPGQVDLIGGFSFGRDRITRAEGMWMETADGRRILDFTGGMGVLNHGHNHPRILAVRRAYAEARRMEVHKLYFSPYVAALAHNIAALLPADLDVSFFPNSGAEAVEGAIKLAHKAHDGRRRHLLHSGISFHGKLLVPGSISASPEVPFRFPSIADTAAYEFDDAGSVERLVSALRRDGSSDVFAIVVEPMSASSLRACSGEFLRRVRALCDAEQIALIFDEVYTGWAKCGDLFYFMRHGVVPDLLCFAKSLGGGKATLGGYVARAPLFRRAYGHLADAMLHTSTFNGFGEETATAIEAINILVEDDYVGRSKRIGAQLAAGLEALRRKHPSAITEVRGAGAHFGIILSAGPELLGRVLRAVPLRMFDEQFLLKLVSSAVMEHMYAEERVLTLFVVNREIPFLLSPSLIATEEEVELALRALDRTLERGLLWLVLDLIKKKLMP